jgi:predicted dehydrogenase
MNPVRISVAGAGQIGQRHPRLPQAEPICSGRDGLKTLLVVDAVVESSKTGQPVDIPM